MAKLLNPQGEEYTEPQVDPADLASRWDRAMKRAFKGVVLRGRPMARATLMQSAERQEREDVS